MNKILSQNKMTMDMAVVAIIKWIRKFFGVKKLLR